MIVKITAMVYLNILLTIGFTLLFIGVLHLHRILKFVVELIGLLKVFIEYLPFFKELTKQMKIYNSHGHNLDDFSDKIVKMNEQISKLQKELNKLKDD